MHGYVINDAKNLTGGVVVIDAFGSVQNQFSSVDAGAEARCEWCN